MATSSADLIGLQQECPGGFGAFFFLKPIRPAVWQPALQTL